MKQRYIDCTVSHTVRQLSEKTDVAGSKYKAPVRVPRLAHPPATFSAKQQ